MLSLWWWVIVLAGLVVGCIGFGLRARDAGVVLMGVGFLLALVTSIYKAIDTFG